MGERWILFFYLINTATQYSKLINYNMSYKICQLIFIFIIVGFSHLIFISIIVGVS